MDLGTRIVLVTGASGWLGVNLARALAHGLPDVATLRTPEPRLTIRCLVAPGDTRGAAALAGISERVEIVTGDVTRAEDCQRFCSGATGALLFHTAGMIHPKRAADFDRVNARGTVALLDAAAESRVRRAVVVSSNSPCGFNPHPDHLFDEASPYRPYQGYGRSKMRMEEAARASHERGAIETVIVRPPWFYGPNQPPRQSLFFKMIRLGKFPMVGPGDNLRSMAYVDNLCQGLLLAAVVARAAGRTYWIADRRPYALAEIVATVRTVLERELGAPCRRGRLRLPALVSCVAELADTGLQRLGLYHQKIHVLSEMSRSIACTVARARRELGYEPTVDLEEGMTRSVRWMVKNGVAI
jgi:nucleoside-diphosphate-sugar epimerase